ncbi:hypothetical protein G7046_g435 [Stylonectria norvegica]|nr:hypothetical protein G7046_g435 [Stylonectria norvegica]
MFEQSEQGMNWPALDDLPLDGAGVLASNCSEGMGLFPSQMLPPAQTPAKEMSFFAGYGNALGQHHSSLWPSLEDPGSESIHGFDYLPVAKAAQPVHPPPFPQPVLMQGILGGPVLKSVILGLMKSYPRMMVEGDQLPPFIQPPCHIDEEYAPDCGEKGRHQCLPKELAICASLVQLFYSRTAANAEFVWTPIHAERHRLEREYHDFSSEELLAAVQSGIILLLLQAEEPDLVHGKVNSTAFIRTIMEMLVTLAQGQDWRTELSRGVPDRRKWLHRESIKRIAILIYIVELLMGEIIVPCSATAPTDHSFRLTPLPANRNIWEARTNRAWKTHYERFVSARKSNETLTVGHVLKASQANNAGSFMYSGGTHYNDQIYADILRWCENLDAMGTLLWLVLPFEQGRSRTGNV